MVAAPRLRKKENTFIPVVTGEKLPALLKVAAIYGPNASGKSNLLRALDTVQLLAKLEPSSGVVKLPISPFRFDSNLANQPSSFEVHFVQDGCRFQFEVSVTQDRIVEERLIAYPKGNESLMYSRRYNGTAEEYVFGEDLLGGRDLHETWRKLTGPRTLFISQAVANSSEDLTQLTVPLRWLRDGIIVVDDGMAGFARASQSLAQDNSGLAEEISKFLQDVDVPVTAIRGDKEEAAAPPGVKKTGTDRFTPDGKTILTHRTALGEADFEFDEESEGTRGLIGFWLPWSLLAKDKKFAFRVLAVDELDSSLHPEIVASLIKRHICFERPAQLIFTTHDTHLMDTKLLRRDQFWLTERDINGATQLRSIHDFEGRESEDIEKRYYEGRYRALPVLSKR